MQSSVKIMKKEQNIGLPMILQFIGDCEGGLNFNGQIGFGPGGGGGGQSGSGSSAGGGGGNVTNVRAILDPLKAYLADEFAQLRELVEDVAVQHHQLFPSGQCRHYR